MISDRLLEVCASSVPQFYFDVDDGDHVTRDEDGLVLADLATACREAVKALPDVAHDVLPDGAERLMSASVRAKLAPSCSAPCSPSAANGRRGR
jgi:hypothetical protein